MSTRALLARLLVAVSLVLQAGVAAQASTILVSPIVVTLGNGSRSAAITVRNDGDEPRVIQTELLRWTQENGENRYAPSRDVLVNPPLATLRPHQSQVFRIGIAGEQDAAQEQAYRLYISEVPVPAQPGAPSIRIVLRVGVGVFVASKAESSARAEWSAVRNQDGSLQLSLRNGGNRHLRLNKLRVTDPGSGKPLGELPPQAITLLAGQTRRLVLPFPPEWQGTQLRLLSDNEGETVQADVPLDSPTMHGVRP